MLEGDPGNREKADLQNAIFPWVFTWHNQPSGVSFLGGQDKAVL